MMTEWNNIKFKIELEACKELLDRFCETKDKDYFYAFSSYLDIILQEYHIMNDIVVDKRLNP